MKIAKGSASWISLTLVVGLVFLVLYLVFNEDELGTICLLLSVISFLKTGFLILFFRDPKRNIGEEIVACADGKIREVTTCNDEEVGERTKISTFMNIHNVHVNRMPFDGTVKNIVHISGIHLPAFRKDSDKNERVITTIDSKIGTIKIAQIAGTIARRIAPYIKKGDKLKKGDKIGIIRFGSRVDVYLPSKKVKVVVKVGDIVKAGEDTIAEIND